jgi:hypothetical protein
MKRTINLDEISIADNHCFAFASTAEGITEEQFMRSFAAGGWSVLGTRTLLSSEEAVQQVRSAVSFKFAVRLLSEFFRSEKKLKSVIEARNKKSREFSNYLTELFGSVRLKVLLIDSGFQPVSVDEFSTYVPTQVGRLLRLEPVAKQLLESEKNFDELLRRFDETIIKAIREGCVGFKTIIAYRTGLDIAWTNEDDAKADFRRMLRKREPAAWFGPLVKNLRDHLVCRTINMCVKHDRVMQIHTGLGDTDILGTKCNPILLETFLKHEEVQRAKVVLVHGGYPYVLEASWLANVLPNVYLELSSPLPPYFAPAVSARTYTETIQQTPSRKIVYGSDAAEFPEMHWLSAKMAKLALQHTLEKLIGLGMLDESEAQEIAGNILFENARRLYKLT